MEERRECRSVFKSTLSRRTRPGSTLSTYTPPAAKSKFLRWDGACADKHLQCDIYTPFQCKSCFTSAASFLCNLATETGPSLKILCKYLVFFASSLKVQTESRKQTEKKWRNEHRRKRRNTSLHMKPPFSLRCVSAALKNMGL